MVALIKKFFSSSCISFALLFVIISTVLAAFNSTTLVIFATVLADAVVATAAILGKTWQDRAMLAAGMFPDGKPLKKVE